MLDTLSSEPGAQLLSIQLIDRLGPSSEQFTDFDALSGLFSSNVKFNDELLLSLAGSSMPDKDGAGQESFSIPPLLEVYNTQFCGISLRMDKTTQIPTVSEWGLLAMAGFMVIAGLAALRRNSGASFQLN